MIYCDTSVIVSAITNENGTASAQHWLREHASAPMAFSAWVETELASALAMKQRRSVLDEDGCAAAESQWHALRKSWLRMPVSERHFVDAARLTSLGLRAGDALHLAIAAEQRLDLVTGDDTLASVAERVGLQVYRPS
jgi:predicted nucleic acid-binding protein